MGMPELLVEGEVIEADPPRRLVQTWRAAWDPELVAEGFTRLTWEISEEDGGISQLTVVHELEGAPKHAAQVASIAPLAQGGGGWMDPERPQDPARSRVARCTTEPRPIGGPARAGSWSLSRATQSPVSTS